MELTERESIRDRHSPDDHPTLSPGGGNGVTLRFGAAMLRMDVLRTAGGETDADPPHPRPTSAWRTPHHGGATRKER
jgi:hypothetical protein